jgi:hypothetical protein
MLNEALCSIRLSALDIVQAQALSVRTLQVQVEHERLLHHMRHMCRLSLTTVWGDKNYKMQNKFYSKSCLIFSPQQ